MKKLAFLIFVISLLSCNEKQDKESIVTTDNIELDEIYAADQADRQSNNIDWLVVSRRDSLRRIRVYELIDSNKIITSRDYHNAAMIFQHGYDSVDYGMAVKLMTKSVELDTSANKWLLAATTDRYLLSKGEPQIYGTQYIKRISEPWELEAIDTTKITDEERKEYGVETLAEQREKVKRLNRKQLSDLLKSNENIDVIIKMINQEDKNNPTYDISESAINLFGYLLIDAGKHDDAIKVFKLNTELYPAEYNTYDSYGECLLLKGDKEGARNAYRKSLELNPNNKNAEKVLSELQ